jgi:predicted dithiol-disulfide oxidoreductase (DUF899 family)
LFLRYLPPSAHKTDTSKIVLYVHGGSFPSALSIAHRFDGRSWRDELTDVEQRVALAVVARSPIDRLIGFKVKRGWRRLKLYSDTSGDYSRDYHALSPKGEDDAAFTVFTRQDGVVRRFWSSEMAIVTADPGQDPRGAPDPAPIWNILDSTPEGRGADWHPKLDYPS